MTRTELIDLVAKMGDEIPCDTEPVVLYDGLEDAFVGLAFRFGWNTPVAVYDQAKALAQLTSETGSPEDAAEHFDFNVMGTWAGEATPIFILRPGGE